MLPKVLLNIRAEVVNSIIDEFIPPQSLEEQWDISGLSKPHYCGAE